MRPTRRSSTASFPTSTRRSTRLRFARLSRALKPGPKSRWAAAGGALLALAAAILLVVNVARVRPVDDGVKGGGPAVLVELSAAALAPSGAVAVSPGARVPADRTLVLRYRASDSGEALLLESRGDDLATVRPLGRFAIAPGVHDLADRGGTEGISLAEERGPYTLWLVVRRGAPVEAGEARAAIRGEGGPGLSVQRFSIVVDPSDTPTP